MVDVALLLLTSGAVGLGCLHSWRYLQRIQQARLDDRAARERAIAQCRGETPRQGSVPRAPKADQAGWD